MQELATSINRRALTLKLLQVNSDTTVSRYVSSCLSFFTFVADLGLDLSALTQVQAVEVVVALRLSKHQDEDDSIDASSAALVHPVNTLKALRWLIKASLLQFPDTYGGLFRALSSGPASDRKEAPALPLDFVAFLEALVLDPGSEPATVSFAGAALLSVWASLRFGDASHVKWSSLLYDVSCHVVRGVAYRTKTTRRGMPFACQGRGIYGYWAATWLRSLDRLWLYLEDSGLCIDPDSLFFVSDAPGYGAGGLDLAFAPASYASALRSLRQALSLWGRLAPAAVANYTLHSSKATALSWAAQLGLQELPRREQGHRRTNSVSLSGRDETFSALALQASLLSRIGDGWRPALAQHRGGQVPVVEPPLLIREHLSAAFLAPPSRFLAQAASAFVVAPSAPASALPSSEVLPEEAPAQASTDAALPLVASTADPSTGAGLSPTGKPFQTQVFLASRKTLHRALLCSIQESQVSLQGSGYKSACGAFVLSGFTILRCNAEDFCEDGAGLGIGAALGSRHLCKRPSCFGAC